MKGYIFFRCAIVIAAVVLTIAFMEGNIYNDTSAVYRVTEVQIDSTNNELVLVGDGNTSLSVPFGQWGDSGLEMAKRVATAFQNPGKSMTAEIEQWDMNGVFEGGDIETLFIYTQNGGRESITGFLPFQVT